MVRKIVTIPNHILRSKSKRIGFVDDSIKKLADDMVETILNWDHDSEFGAALAAIQIAEPLKLTVVRNSFETGEDKTFTTLINPEVIKISRETVVDIEGCLSVPGVYGRVRRALKIKVKALDANNQPIRLSAEGFAARVIQHEIDHMDGVIFLDHVTDAKDLFHIDKAGHLRPLKGDKPKLP
ncbi:peptide deformylase [Candidatus Saccharibacteria bacterium]|nr:peptide deformylase [Candidatus Saccharibacteria bacterium]